MKEFLKRQSLRLYLIFAASALAACATSSQGVHVLDDRVPLEFAMPATTFILPEANGGDLSGHVQFLIASGPHVELISDVDDVSYSTVPKLYSGFGADLLVDVGIFEKIDLYYNHGVGIKFQLLGESRKKAQVGYSLSVAYNHIRIDEENRTEDTTGSVKVAETKMEGDGHRYALIVGKRKDAGKLLYGGLFYSSAEINSVELYQTNKTNFTFNGEVNKGAGQAYGINLGFMRDTDKKLFKTFSVNYGFELAYAHSDWKKKLAPIKKVQEDSAHIGAQLGFGW